MPFQVGVNSKVYILSMRKNVKTFGHCVVTTCCNPNNILNSHKSVLVSTGAAHLWISTSLVVECQVAQIQEFQEKTELLVLHKLFIECMYLGFFYYIQPTMYKAPIVHTKAWLATYFELPHPQLRNPKSLRTRNHVQLAFLMVATRNRNRNFIKF